MVSCFLLRFLIKITNRNSRTFLIFILQIMQPRLIHLKEKKCVGTTIEMSLDLPKNNKLWGIFMSRRKEIYNPVSKDLISLSVYKPDYFTKFNPSALFTKWALIEVTDYNSVPKALERFTIESGLYAVFLHRGTTDTFYKTSQYIFETWLHNSIYELDDRPHFELLQGGYINGAADSEEEVWIPLK